MFTIKKIWNALNHAGKPWQIAMAVALGMLVGFTPLYSVHNIIVVLAILVFNIHLSVFLLAVSFFGIVGLVLDPLFASLGKTILTSSSLENLFTSWFNNPFGHLSYFNNTITMGSLVVSLVLLLVVYKITSFLLVKYRVVIATKLKNIPILNKMSFFQNEEEKEIKTFRLIGLIVIVFFCGLISIFNIIFLDGIIKSNLETALNKSSKKIVQIDDLSTSFFSSSVMLKEVNIKNKENNDDNINIKNITIDINLGQLIFERVILDNVKIDGINFPAEVKEKKVEPKLSSKKEVKNNSKTSTSDVLALKDINSADIQKDFDKKIKKDFEKYKEYYEKIKPLFNQEEKVVENRADGKFVYFPLESNLPSFLIKKGTFSVLKNDVLVNGTFKDFTTNQKLYKKPFTVLINTKTKEFDSFVLNASLLETNEKQEDILKVKVDGYNTDEIIEKNISIQNTKLNTIIDMKILDQSKIIGSQSLDVLSTDIAFHETNKYIKVLNKSLIKTKGIKSNIFISGTIDSPKFKIDSNIDKILKKKIKNVLASQKDEIKKEVTNKVKEKVKSKLDKKLKGILGF